MVLHRPEYYCEVLCMKSLGEVVLGVVMRQALSRPPAERKVSLLAKLAQTVQFFSLSPFLLVLPHQLSETVSPTPPSSHPSISRSFLFIFIPLPSSPAPFIFLFPLSSSLPRPLFLSLPSNSGFKIFSQKILVF